MWYLRKEEEEENASASSTFFLVPRTFRIMLGELFLAIWQNSLIKLFSPAFCAQHQVEETFKLLVTFLSSCTVSSDLFCLSCWVTCRGDWLPLCVCGLLLLLSAPRPLAWLFSPVAYFTVSFCPLLTSLSVLHVVSQSQLSISWFYFILFSIS